MRFTFAPFVAALLPLVVMSASAANFDARAFAGPAVDVVESSQTPAVARVVAVDSSLPTLFTANAYALTDTAGIHLSAVTAVIVDTRDAATSLQLSATESRALGRFSDSFTVLSEGPALFGTAGRALVSLGISGALTGTGSGGTAFTGWDGRSSWEASATFYGKTPTSWSGGRAYSASQYFPEGSIDPINASPLIDFGTHSFWVPFTFGTPLGMELKGEVVGQVGAVMAEGGMGLVDARFSANLSNTIAWGGILELRDANGALVTDYTARSDTLDFDYRHAYVAAVPELPAWSALLLGLGLLTARRAKGRSAPPAS